MRAAKGKLDRARGLLSLEGGVLGVQGHDVLLADSALIDLRARSAEMHSAVLYLKERAANPDNPKSGRNTLILHGSRLRQLPDGYTAENVTLTPCDCEGDPDFELLASSAHLEGDRAHLSGVRLHIRGPPIPLFPLSLPLTERQWGLLQPTFGIGGPAGFAYAQPVFFTLGRSNDSTITPGWFTGGSNPHHLSDTTNRTVRGPRFGLEWRYAPVAGTSGAIGLDLFDDLDAHDSPAQAPPAAGEPGTSPGRGFGGVRGVAHLACGARDGRVGQHGRRRRGAGHAGALSRFPLHRGGCVEVVGSADPGRGRDPAAGRPHRRLWLPRPAAVRRGAARDVPALAGAVRAARARVGRAGDCFRRSQRGPVRVVCPARRAGTDDGIRADGPRLRPATRRGQRRARAGHPARSRSAPRLRGAGGPAPRPAISTGRPVRRLPGGRIFAAQPRPTLRNSRRQRRAAARSPLRPAAAPDRAGHRGARHLQRAAHGRSAHRRSRRRGRRGVHGGARRRVEQQPEIVQFPRCGGLTTRSTAPRPPPARS